MNRFDWIAQKSVVVINVHAFDPTTEIKVCRYEYTIDEKGYSIEFKVKKNKDFSKYDQVFFDSFEKVLA